MGTARTGELCRQNGFNISGLNCVDSPSQKKVLLERVSRLRYHIEEKLEYLLPALVVKGFEEHIKAQRPF